MQSRIFKVCFNPEFADDAAVDKDLEASFAPIVSQVGYQSIFRSAHSQLGRTGTVHENTVL